MVMACVRRGVVALAAMLLSHMACAASVNVPSIDGAGGVVNLRLRGGTGQVLFVCLPLPFLYIRARVDKEWRAAAGAVEGDTLCARFGDG